MTRYLLGTLPVQNSSVTIERCLSYNPFIQPSALRSCNLIWRVNEVSLAAELQNIAVSRHLVSNLDSSNCTGVSCWCTSWSFKWREEAGDNLTKERFDCRCRGAEKSDIHFYQIPDAYVVGIPCYRVSTPLQNPDNLLPGFPYIEGHLGAAQSIISGRDEWQLQQLTARLERRLQDMKPFASGAILIQLLYKSD